MVLSYPKADRSLFQAPWRVANKSILVKYKQIFILTITRTVFLIYKAGLQLLFSYPQCLNGQSNLFVFFRPPQGQLTCPL